VQFAIVILPNALKRVKRIFTSCDCVSNFGRAGFDPAAVRGDDCKSTGSPSYTSLEVYASLGGLAKV
jgi:hypothetical protein